MEAMEGPASFNCAANFSLFAQVSAGACAGNKSEYRHNEIQNVIWNNYNQEAAPWSAAAAAAAITRSPS
jgi:hypothetical protein